MLFSNRTYDVVKHVVQLVLPAIGAFYFALAEIWGLPYAAQVVGTIAALTTFLGVSLRISDKSYAKTDSKYDGVMHVEADLDGEVPKTLVDLELNYDPALLLGKKEISFKVDSPK
jgi:hypothetical protein